MVYFKTKFSSVVLELSGSEHLHWILSLDVVHTIWVLWMSDLQECKGNVFLKSGGEGNIFSVRFKKKNWKLYWDYMRGYGSQSFALIQAQIPSPTNS